jgi:uncharacterized protein YdeI (YjbR/CyaY-like superfamily)
MGFVEDAPRVHLESAAQWREWLEEHHRDSSGVFLVSWRRGTGRPAISYDDMVEQALCFGWIDSRAAQLDDRRTMLWFTPRRRGGGWSSSNKERVGRLVAQGLMRPAGLAAVDAAHADGSWDALTTVEAGEAPEDLVAAFAKFPGSAEQFAAFSPSARKALISWILIAKTPGTRDRRITETASKAARGEKANQWTRRPSA